MQKSGEAERSDPPRAAAGKGLTFAVELCVVLLMIYKSCTTLRTLNYGNYGLSLFMSNAGFMSSTVVVAVIVMVVVKVQ